MIPSCWSRREACGLQAVTLVVPDHDAGSALFAGKPGFGLIGDTPRGGGRRRVMVAPRGGIMAWILSPVLFSSARWLAIRKAPE